jgi:ribosomal protein L40E
MRKTPVTTYDIAAHRVINPVRPPDHDPGVLTAAAENQSPSDESLAIGAATESRPCRRCGATSPPGAERCQQCKSFLRGMYRAGGRHAATLSPEYAERLGDLDGFKAGVLADQGGEQGTTVICRGYVDKLAAVEAQYRLLLADVTVAGIFTKRGRVRSTFTALMSTIDRWDRLAGRLGMSRKQRDLTTLTAAQYASWEPPEDDAPGTGPEGEDDAAV